MPNESELLEASPGPARIPKERRLIRRRAGMVGLVIIGAVIGAGAALFAERPPAVILPSASASVEQTAVAYLANWAAGRCDTLDALSTPGQRDGCSGVTLLGYGDIGAVQILQPPETAQKQDCVPTQIDSDGSADGSFPTGWQPWNLCFVQTSQGWRLIDSGQG